MGFVGFADGPGDAFVCSRQRGVHGSGGHSRSEAFVALVLPVVHFVQCFVWCGPAAPGRTRYFPGVPHEFDGPSGKLTSGRGHAGRLVASARHDVTRPSRAPPIGHEPHLLALSRPDVISHASWPRGPCAREASLAHQALPLGSPDVGGVLGSGRLYGSWGCDECGVGSAAVVYTSWWCAWCPVERPPPGDQRGSPPGADRCAVRDPPERFGPWETVHERHLRWSADGTWQMQSAAVAVSAPTGCPTRSTALDDQALPRASAAHTHDRGSGRPTGFAYEPETRWGRLCRTSWTPRHRRAPAQGSTPGHSPSSRAGRSTPSSLKGSTIRPSRRGPPPLNSVPDRRSPHAEGGAAFLTERSCQGVAWRRPLGAAAGLRARTTQ